MLLEPLSTGRPRSARFATVSTALVAVLAPLVLFAFNRDWLLTPAAFVDPWHYVGFFHDYWNPEFGLGSYKVARLPWILSGMFAWSVLPPLPASYSLHLSYLCATTLAAFIGVRRLFGQTSLAAVVALCLGFYTHAHGAGGWDYHNTAAGAFYLMTFAALASPGALAGRRVAMVVVGILAALTLHSNITLVNFVPALAFVYVYVAHRAGWRLSARTVALRVAWTLAGAFAVTAALSLVNWSAGRGVVFFQNLVITVVRFVGDPRNQVTYRLETGWYYRAVHLALPAAVFVAGGMAIAWKRNRRDADSRLAAVLILQFLCMAFVWSGWQAAGQTALDWDYFAYALVPSCFIGSAGLLKLAWKEQYERQALPIALGTAAALALTLGGGAERLILPVEATVGRIIMPAAALVFAVGFAAAFLRPAAAALPAFVIAFALANRLAAPGAPATYALTDRCKTEPAIYAAIVDAGEWLGSIDPSDRRIRTWFDARERITLGPNGCSVSIGDIGQSVTAMAYTGLLVDPRAIGDVSPAAIEAVSDGDSIVAVISASTQARDVWDMRLGELGLTRRELASHHVKVGDAALEIEAWGIEQPPPAGVVFGQPLVVIDHGSREDSRQGAAPPAAVAPHARVTYPPSVISVGSGGAWARLRLDISGQIAPCHVVLQDQKGQSLASVPCASGTRYVLLPARTQTMAIALENTTSRSASLPARIEVSLPSQ
jgi:hypothetical protein